MTLGENTLLTHYFSLSSLYSSTGMSTTLAGYAVAKRRHALVLSVYKILLSAKRGISFAGSCGAQSSHFWIAVGTSSGSPTAFADMALSHFLRSVTYGISLQRKKVNATALMLWKSSLRPAVYLKWHAGSLTNYRKLANKYTGKNAKKTKAGLLTSRIFPTFLLSLTPAASSIALREASIFGVPSIGLVDPAYSSYVGDATFNILAPAGGLSISFVFCGAVLDEYYSQFAQNTLTLDFEPSFF